MRDGGLDPANAEAELASGVTWHEFRIVMPPKDEVA